MSTSPNILATCLLGGGLLSLAAAEGDPVDLEERIRQLERELATVKLDLERKPVAATERGMMAKVANALQNLEIHGAVSQGFAWCDAPHKYQSLDTDRGTFALTDMTLSITKQVTDELRFGVQLYNRNFGAIGNHQFELDYAYGDYHFRDWLGLRVGRVKTRVQLHNASQDQDYAHPWVLPPFAAYDAANRGLMLNHDGLDLYGVYDLGDHLTLDYTVFGGGAVLPSHEGLEYYFEEQDLTIKELDIHYIVGGDLRCHVGGAATNVTFGGSYLWVEYTDLMSGIALIPMLPPGIPRLVPPVALLPFDLRLASTEPIKFTNVYATWELGDFNLSAEGRFVDHHLETTYMFPGLPTMSQVAEAKSRGWYVLGSYRWSVLGPGWERLQTSCYFSSYVRDKRIGFTNGNNYLRDLAGTVRYDFNKNLYLKVEVHHMQGWGWNQFINLDTPGHKSEHWTMLAVKTGISF